MESPFASSAALQKVIDKVNSLQDRVTILTLMNLEFSKLLIDSGHMNREAAIGILDSIAKARSGPEHEDGEKYVKIIRDLLASQTSGADDASA